MREKVLRSRKTRTFSRYHERRCRKYELREQTRLLRDSIRGSRKKFRGGGIVFCEHSKLEFSSPLPDPTLDLCMNGQL